MVAPSTTKLTGLLEKAGLFTAEQIESILVQNRQTDNSISDIVVALGYARENVFLKALAEAMRIPYVQISDMEIPQDVLQKLPTKAVFQYNVIPISTENGSLRVATHDPFSPGLVDALRLASGMRIRLALSPSADLDKAAKTFYGVGADTLEKMIQDDRIEVTPDEDLQKADLSDLDQEASVVKFVNQIIWEAYQDRATDIHLEPMEESLRIRYRIDGVLHQTPVPAHLKRFQSAIISRIKVMSNMDIAEKRLPQDGRISLRIRGEEIDVRVSTMPTVYGESVSLRLLMRHSGLIGLDKLGLNANDEAILKKLINKPHGILLVTGPTGSGKSTSLYAWLHTINSTDKRIITTEEPIEYEMPGVNQIQVRPEIGLTFAMGLRHILRQDPDVIMVGEIRDLETAEIAIRAALTGHLVFSTLHTNDAAGAVTRLVDMGIEPFLVASSVEGLVAQRLIRKLCPSCKRPRKIDEDLLRGMEFPMERISEGTIYEPVGCEECRGTGFRGRTGMYEIIVVDEPIRKLIVARASSATIKQEAMRHGMHTLRDDGWTKVLDGVTTIEEVLRVSEEDEALTET
ncbi:MAG: Flp pilus assembly complex ATPase component TadA [Verrucomicrobia bacterium]|nr:Flp pilus assembly complex ATPase component TadA [Verrucomicrobiota bacterium]